MSEILDEVRSNLIFVLWHMSDRYLISTSERYPKSTLDRYLLSKSVWDIPTLGHNSFGHKPSPSSPTLLYLVFSFSCTHTNLIGPPSSLPPTPTLFLRNVGQSDSSCRSQKGTGFPLMGAQLRGLAGLEMDTE